jgi:hypothetical protein
MAYALDNSDSGARTENIAHNSFWSTLGGEGWSYLRGRLFSQYSLKVVLSES